MDPPPVGTLKDDAVLRDTCIARGRKGIVDEVGKEGVKGRARRGKRVGVFGKGEARRKGVWDVKPGTVIR